MNLNTKSIGMTFCPLTPKIKARQSCSEHHRNVTVIICNLKDICCLNKVHIFSILGQNAMKGTLWFQINFIYFIYILTMFDKVNLLRNIVSFMRKATES